MLGDPKCLGAMRLSREGHLWRIRETLLMYRGRVACILDEKPTVDIYGRIIWSRFDQRNQRVILHINIRTKQGEALVVDVYPDGVRSYYTTGVKSQSRVSDNHCPVTLKLLDPLPLLQ